MTTVLFQLIAALQTDQIFNNPCLGFLLSFRNLFFVLLHCVEFRCLLLLTELYFSKRRLIRIRSESHGTFLPPCLIFGLPSISLRVFFAFFSRHRDVKPCLLLLPPFFLRLISYFLTFRHRSVAIFSFRQQQPEHQYKTEREIEGEVEGKEEEQVVFLLEPLVLAKSLPVAAAAALTLAEIK